jgi:hypothetical protein
MLVAILPIVIHPPPADIVLLTGYSKTEPVNEILLSPAGDIIDRLFNFCFEIDIIFQVKLLTLEIAP